MGADYARLPELLNSPDAVEDGGSSDNGTPLVRIVKTIGVDRYTAVFAVLHKRRMLSLQTMWVRPGAPPR